MGIKIVNMVLGAMALVVVGITIVLGSVVLAGRLILNLLKN